MKTAGASVTSTPALVPPILNNMRKISACLRKLSLNAAKNWHQNSGAKRRVSSRDMASPVVRTGAGPGRADVDDIFGKRTIARKAPGAAPPRPARAESWVIADGYTKA